MMRVGMRSLCTQCEVMVKKSFWVLSSLGLGDLGCIIE